MMYLALVLLAALLLGYFAGRWLLRESREGYAAARQALKAATGGQSPERLIRDTRTRLAEHGLSPDLIAVPDRAETVYDALRRQVIGRVPRPALPAAPCFAFAVDAVRATAYVRTAWGPPGRIATEREAFVAFAELGEIRVVPLEAHPAIASNAETALEFTGTPEGSACRLPVDPAWGVPADDLAERLRAMVRDRRRLPGGPVILR